MSYSSFDRLTALLGAHEDQVFAGPPASADQIREAESFLGLTFPEDYKLYLATWGALSVGWVEFYGLVGDDFEESSIPDGIWFTQTVRGTVGLPHHLIVLVDNDGDQYLCLDTSGDPEVVVWDVGLREVTGSRGDLFGYMLGEATEVVS